MEKILEEAGVHLNHPAGKLELHHHQKLMEQEIFRMLALIILSLLQRLSFKSLWIKLQLVMSGHSEWLCIAYFLAKNQRAFTQFIEIGWKDVMDLILKTLAYLLLHHLKVTFCMILSLLILKNLLIQVKTFKLLDLIIYLVSIKNYKVVLVKLVLIIL